MDDDKLDREAASLGVKISKVTIGGGKGVKNPEAELKRHEGLIRQRTENRIKKKKAKPVSPMQARKVLLTARLASTSIYTREQVRQMKFELRAIKNKSWKMGMRAPKKESVFQEVMNMPG